MTLHADEFCSALRSMCGVDHVLTNTTDQAPYLIDWRKKYLGRACAVVRPATTSEVAAVVRLCAAERVAIVPQGGNTGLVGGGTPDDSGRSIVLSLRRMNRIRQVDTQNNTLTAEAGVILQHVQEEARGHDRLFPLSLASEGSCTLGGNLSTNAGGTAVLRYGNTRDLCLGLEVVTPNGEILGMQADGNLRGLRKDNTGYDLKHLYIGAEGTLGIITAACMKLYPLPRAQRTAFATVPSPTAALDFLTRAQSACGATLTGFELISDFALSLVERHYAPLASPFKQRSPWYVLLEISDHEDDAHATALLESVMENALEADLIGDAVVAQSLTQSRDLWLLREHISEAQAREGSNIKHDVSVPISRLATFIDVAAAQLQRAFPGVRLVIFGHLGDGNLHYNVSPAVGENDTVFQAKQEAINLIVHDQVAAHSGSISAEHGLGQLRRDEIVRYKPASELAVMRMIKNALDPLGIMNPGKILLP